MAAFILLCALIAGVLTAGCGPLRNPIELNVALGTPFDMKIGTTAVVPGGLAIRFDAVASDSRCPINATCVHAGEAVVVMTFAERSRTRVQRELRTTPNGSQVTHADYTISLMELQPYPFAGHPTPQSDYVATVTVTRR
jgi:hypothetical protein